MQFKIHKEVLMFAFFSTILGFFGHISAQSPDYVQDEYYKDMRQMALNVTADQLQIDANDDNILLGTLMETGFNKAVATLLMMRGGTVSLYFSNGGGIIGAGEHEKTREACNNFLEAVPSFIKYANKTIEFPLPLKNYTRFYFITKDGVFTVEFSESELRNHKTALSPLYYIAQEVITQARLQDERQRGRAK